MVVWGGEKRSPDVNYMNFPHWHETFCKEHLLAAESCSRILVQELESWWIMTRTAQPNVTFLGDQIDYLISTEQRCLSGRRKTGKKQLKPSGLPTPLKGHNKINLCFSSSRPLPHHRPFAKLTKRFGSCFQRLAFYAPRSFRSTSWKWHAQREFLHSWVNGACSYPCLCVLAFIKLERGCRKTSWSWLIHPLKLIKRAGQNHCGNVRRVQRLKSNFNYLFVVVKVTERRWLIVIEAVGMQVPRQSPTQVKKQLIRSGIQYRTWWHLRLNPHNNSCSSLSTSTR